jgi:hypothetical protein
VSTTLLQLHAPKSAGCVFLGLNVCLISPRLALRKRRRAVSRLCACLAFMMRSASSASAICLPFCSHRFMRSALSLRSLMKVSSRSHSTMRWRVSCESGDARGGCGLRRGVVGPMQTTLFGQLVGRWLWQETAVNVQLF